MSAPFKSGTVAIVGKPNVGKSTLLNALVGEKVAIVSEKPETTRSKILGILTGLKGQIVFVDTPGIHKPRILLGKEMVRLARSSLLEVDLVLCMIDAASPIGQDDQVLFDLIREDKPACFLLLNKIDQIRKGRLLPLIDECRRIYPFGEIIPISALKADGLDRLVSCILTALPEGPALFPGGEVTDRGPEFMISELIREAALAKTWEEVPHSIAVAIDELKDRSAKLTYVQATLYVERDSQRKILIGKRGEMLKAIGESARQEIQNYLGRRVYLDLWVKVLEHWRKDARALKRLGYA